MTTAQDETTALIANAKAKSEAALNQAISYTNSAQTVAMGYTDFLANPSIIPESFAVPVFTPNKDLGAAYKTDFDTEWGGMEAWMRGLMSDYVNTYFPVLDPAIPTSSNTWLLGVINNGYQGIPTPVETAMWNRAREKEIQEALRMEDESATQMSSRGFSAPPGVLYNRLQTVQQDAANKTSTIARDLAIRQTEISVEMTKFAIEETTKLRLGIAAALADFMRAWLSVPQVAADVAKTKAEMHRILWDSSANYIHALVAKAGLKMDADKSMLFAKVQTDTNWLHNFLGSQELRVNAAIAGAKELGAVASAYAASMSTLGYTGAVNNTQG